MGKLIAINISEKRGTEKKEIQEAKLVTDFGIAGDAHAVNGTGRSVFYLLKKSKISRPEEPESKTEPSGRI